jgi:CRP/FNR family nitrogen fixation transcriptional regulator
MQHSDEKSAPVSSHRAAEGQSISLEDVFRAIGSTKKFERGQEIYPLEETSDVLCQIVSGAVRTITYFADGRRQVGAFYVPREIFGYELDGDSHFAAETLLASEIVVAKRSQVIELALSTPRLGRELLLRTSAAVRRCQDHLLILGRQTAEERLRAFLADLARRLGNSDCVDLPMDRRDISDYLGLALETVSRSFTDMHHRGVIEILSPRRISLVGSPRSASVASRSAAAEPLRRYGN